MNKERFALNLRQLRLEKGYTQEHVAAELGTSPQSVSRWECGNTLPDAMQLPSLARVYGVTIEDLYSEQRRFYPNYAQRLLAIFECSDRTEDFLIAEQEFVKLLSSEHTADDLKACGMLYYHMMKLCALKAKKYLGISAISPISPDAKLGDTDSHHVVNSYFWGEINE